MHLDKSAILLKKVVGSDSPNIEVVLRYPRTKLSADELGQLMAFSGNPVRVALIGADTDVDPSKPRPLDLALEQAENGPAREERARPLAHERCRRCGLEIGDDEDAGFLTPRKGGRPTPFHGSCLEQMPDEWDDEEPSADQQLEDLLALVNLGPTVPVAEWSAEERQQATAWVDAVRAQLEGPPGNDVAVPERPAFLDEKTTALPTMLMDAAADGPDGDAADDLAALPVPEVPGVPALTDPEAPIGDRDLNTIERPETPERVLPGRGRGGRR